MPLAPGAQLGPYQIVAPIGAGGMGEVYRAHDSKLGRQVALKLLPETFSEDKERLARLRREAQVLASLNHPQIAAIYGLEETDGSLALVLELVEGDSLDVRMKRGAIPVDEALVLARQVALGLEAAHEKGVIHRDLKPANIKVTPDGNVKLVDFGLAKAFDSDGAASEDVSQSPTLSRGMTEAGLILGTAAYMSPEQARGKSVDKRADVWAFGVVLYEMLTGRRLFEGETVSDTLAAVLTKDPDWSKLPSGTPAPLRRLLRLCLVRDVRQRLHDIGDARLALEEIAADDAPSVPAPTTAPRRPWALAVVSALLAIALGALALRPPPASPDPVRLRKLTFSGADREPSASPDGKLIAFTSTRDGVSRIWLKQLEGGGEQPLTEGPDSRPRFAPDGASVLYIHDDGQALSAYRIALVGGQPRRVLADVVEADISPDGRRVAFVRTQRKANIVIRDELGVASADGREERILLNRPGGLLKGARWSPDGRRLAAVAAGLQLAVPSSLILVDPESGAAEDRGPLGSRSALSGPAWLADSSGLLVAISSNRVGNAAGMPSLVVHHDLHTGQTHSLFWAPDLFSRSGRFSSVLTMLGPGRICFDGYGQTEALRETEPGGRERELTQGAASDRQPVYSPDGRQIVFSSNRSGNLDLWSVDRTTRALRQITDDAAQDWDPAFSPDGRQLLFTSDRSGSMEIWIANADGSGARQVTRDGVDAQNATMAADGWIVYASGNPSKQGIWKVRSDGATPALLVVGGSGPPEVSLDGRSAIYTAGSLPNLLREVRAVEIGTGTSVDFRIPLRGATQTGNLSFGRGRWLPAGRAIAFLDLDERGRSGIFVQDFIPGRDTSATRRKLAGFYNDALTESFGISPDGSRVTLAVVHEDRSLMLAENVSGVR